MTRTSRPRTLSLAQCLRMFLVLVSATLVSASVRAVEPEGLSLAIWILRPDTLRLQIISPHTRYLPTSEALRQRLAGAGMQIERVNISSSAGQQVMSVIVHMVEAANQRGGHSLRLGELTQAVGDSLSAPLLELRLVAPHFLEFTWSGSIPSRSVVERMSYAEYVFRPAPVTSQVHARFYPRSDLSARARQTGLWALLPVMVGAVMGLVVSRQSAKLPPGRLPFLAYLIFPAILVTSYPFMSSYTRWLAGWVEWQFSSPVLGGVAGFLPIPLVLLGAAAPLLHITYRSWKGIPQTQKKRIQRVTMLRLFPVFIAAGINVVLILGSDLLATPHGIWRALLVQGAVLLLGLGMAPLLVRWVFSPQPLNDPALQAILSQAKQSRLQPGGIYLISATSPTPEPNAFVMGMPPWRPIILLTEDLTRLLAVDELKAIIAHEMGHVVHHHLLKRFVVLMASASRLAAFRPWLPAGIAGNPFAYLGLGLAFIHLIYTAVSRVQEYEADGYAAQITGPAALAGALEKLAAAYADHLPWNKWLWWIQTHPHIEARLRRIKSLVGSGHPHRS